MPRPAKGYFNAAGQPIPGTSDIIKRFKNCDRLMFWAFGRGKAGHAKLYDDSALSIGTATHTMCELHLKGQTQKDIDFYLTATLPDPEQQQKARSAFGAFLQWVDNFHVEPHVFETSLVSERLQYGGTLDVVAHVRGELGLIDFKTSSSGEIYEDHVLQLAAYQILWDETHPREPLTNFHLIVLPKNGDKPVHREFTRDDLHPYRQKVWLYVQAYRLDAICNDPKVLAGIAVAPSVKPAEPKVHAARKPRARPAIAPRPESMAAVLRTYGHVRDGVPA